MKQLQCPGYSYAVDVSIASVYLYSGYWISYSTVDLTQSLRIEKFSNSNSGKSFLIIGNKVNQHGIVYERQNMGDRNLLTGLG